MHKSDMDLSSSSQKCDFSGLWSGTDTPDQAGPDQFFSRDQRPAQKFRLGSAKLYWYLFFLKIIKCLIDTLSTDREKERVFNFFQKFSQHTDFSAILTS